MAFLCFIKKYYLPQQQAEITQMLKTLGIYSETESLFNEFYQAAYNKHKIEIISQFVLTCRELVTIIFNKLLGNQCGQEKTCAETMAIGFLKYLAYETHHLSGLNIADSFDLLKITVRKICSRHTWDFSAIEQHLNADLSKTVSNKKAIAKAQTSSKPLKLNWQASNPLDFFIDDLTKVFPTIKKKKQVYRLFDYSKPDFKIELPSKDLLPFLTLFYKLHESTAIKVIGNRGLYVFLHQHLQAPPKDRYPKRDFRKLRNDAEQNIQLKSNILLLIKPLLDKYCSSLQVDASWTIAN